MKKGRLTKQEQSLRFKLLFEFIFIFKYATRAQLDLYTQTAIKLQFPQRLIEYALNKGYLDRYYEPNLRAKIYFLTKKGEDFLYDNQPLIEHYAFEKGNTAESSFLKHNLLVDTYFMLNEYMEVGLQKWKTGWLLRRSNRQRFGRLPDAVFVTAGAKIIAVEAVVGHKGLVSLKRMVNFYQSEIENNHNYQAVLIVASCTYRYDHLRKYLFAINPDFCPKAFILAEPEMLEQGGSCFYQGKLMTIEGAFRLVGKREDEVNEQVS